VSDRAVIIARDLRKEYTRGSETVAALRSATFSVARGEVVAVVGRSGSGKTTLLKLLGALDVPTSGELEVAGQAVTGMSEVDRTRLRRSTIGFVFQDFALLPALSALDNVVLPLAFRRQLKLAQQAAALLERVGLGHRLHHRPSELSGGEMQRVAIARALVSRPALVLADEPTGNLDTPTGEQIFNILRELADSDGVAVVLSTHSPLLAQRADRCLELEDGCLIDRARI
jgi:ABC-type lipoprotein export system ATPase subunit